MLKFKSQIFLLSTSIFLISGFSYATNSNMTTQESTGQYVSDASITTKVKSDFLLDKDIKSLSISVTTDKGLVTLNGNVENAMQKKEAVKVARHVVGVTSVKDELVITTNTKMK